MYGMCKIISTWVRRKYIQLLWTYMYLHVDTYVYTVGAHYMYMYVHLCIYTLHMELYMYNSCIQCTCHTWCMCTLVLFVPYTYCFLTLHIHRTICTPYMVFSLQLVGWVAWVYIRLYGSRDVIIARAATPSERSAKL